MKSTIVTKKAAIKTRIIVGSISLVILGFYIWWIVSWWPIGAILIYPFPLWAIPVSLILWAIVDGDKDSYERMGGSTDYSDYDPEVWK